MSEIYTRDYLERLVDAGEILTVAERDPRVLEVVDTGSVSASEEQALDFIEHGYGNRVSIVGLSREFVELHHDNLTRFGRMGELSDEVLAVIDANRPNITPWILVHMGVKRGRGYAERCSPEFLARFEQVAAVFKGLRHKEITRDIWDDREIEPDEFTAYIARHWLPSDGGMDDVNTVIDWLIERGEFALLATCFDGDDWLVECDALIALAMRAPETLKFVRPRVIICQSNTVADLYLMRGRGRLLDPMTLEPDMVTEHWDQIAPMGSEWFERRWLEILLAANELPKFPIPMFLLVELGRTAGDSQRFADHLDHVTRYCQGYDDYRTLYESLL